MPPKVVKRGAAAKKAKDSSKTAIQNPQQESEPEPVKNHDDNHVADVVGEDNPIETNNLAQEIVHNGLNVVECKFLFLSFIDFVFCGIFSFFIYMQCCFIFVLSKFQFFVYFRL
jgi:hypothetical protein